MRRDTLLTRRKLIAAAEQLFATRGIDGVSLADINQRAGQKNRNAIHYHFGNKDKLISAVLDKHSEPIEQRRGQMLDALGDTPSLRQVVEALVIPIAEQLDDPDGGVAYIKINSQLMANERYVELRFRRVEEQQQTRRMGRLFAGLVTDIAREQQTAKMLLIDSLVFQGLAYYTSRKPEVSREAFINTLMTSIEQILDSP